MTQRVFVDANILMSKTLLDWLYFLRFGNQGMFQLHSSEDVFAETIAGMRKKNPRAAGHFTRRRVDLIRKAIDEVVADYKPDERFTGSDENDFHVHAAAVASRADIVLTNNKPEDITATPDEEPYEIFNADDFFRMVVRSSPHCLTPIVVEQCEYWKKKPNHLQLDDSLRRAGCPQFADEVLTELQKIARCVRR